MIRFDSRVRLTGPFLALALVVACGSEKKQDTQKDVESAPVRPQISGFEARPASIIAGETATLAWTIQNAVSFSLVDDAGTSVPVDGLPMARGSVGVTPERTTEYRLSAFGPAGSPGADERTLTVRVDHPKSPPAIESFSASAGVVIPGGEVTLSWRTTGATALTLEDDAGEVIDHGGDLENGSVIVTPTRTRTVYTLVATGNGHRVEKQIEIDVLGLPRIHEFFVQPIEPVVAGTSVTLRWETARAERVVITDDAGATVLETTTALSGSHSPNPAPTRTTEYTLTATGNGATTIAKVLARVGARIDEFTAVPAVARLGDPITLSWKTGGADSIVITAPDGFSYEVPTQDILGGSTVAPLVEGGNYLLSARIGTVVREWAVHVEVTEAPLIFSLVVDTTVITAAPDYPNHVLLTFAQTGGTACFLYRNDEAIPGFDPFTCEREQTVEVELTGAADLRLVVTNHAGDDQDIVRVDAVEPARIVSFTKDPERRLVSGGTVELAWHVTGAAVVRLERDDEDVGIGASELTGKRNATVPKTAVFRLIAENSIGHIVFATQTVHAGAPEILAFGTGARVVAPGDELTFAWTCDGGDTLVLTDDDGEKKADIDVTTEIDVGTSTFAAPGTPGSYEYTLTVRNSVGQETTAFFELIVTDGPLIRSFTTPAGVISLGETLYLSWEVTDDWTDNPPLLTLEDNFDTPYDLTDVDKHEATFSLVPNRRGDHVFTLTAWTNGTTQSVATVKVEVVDAPMIVVFAADPQVLHTDGSLTPHPVTLEWETENAAELAIFEADADGAAIPPALFRLVQADGATRGELDRGTVIVQPVVSTRYLLWIRNGVGTILDEVIQILVDPVEIGEFKAEPPELVRGESTTLSWTTVNATRMMLQPPVPTVTEIPGTWIDISADPMAKEVLMGSADNSFNVVAFPPDFRFPYDGDLRTGVLISMNGFLGFDLKAQPANESSSNSNLPAGIAEKAFVHLAPFWDDLQSYANGKLYTLFDDDARTFTVMWKNWSCRLTTGTFDLNFQVVLHEDGNFEYRFGEMTATGGTTNENRANCSSCTIGFQDTTRSFGHVVRYNSRFASASNLGWFFTVAPRANGSVQGTPTADRTYKLTALDPYHAVSESITVRVWQLAAIAQASVHPVGPDVGTPYTVSWRASPATRVRLLDEQGAILCEETDPARIAKGSCERREERPGLRNYTLEAINGFDGNKATHPVIFTIYDTLSLDSFEVSDPILETGSPVTVRWKGRGGFEAELYECVPRAPLADCIRLDIRGEDPNDGSYTTTPLFQSKEYRFHLLDRDYRVERASATSWVDIPKFTSSFASSRSQIAAGEEVTLSWASDGTYATLDNFPMGIVEVQSSPYDDISSSGTKASLSFGDLDKGGYVIEFEDDFRFVFDGNVFNGVSVRTDGWIGFDLALQDTKETNARFPTTSGNAMVNLAPFWTNLVVPEGGGVYYKFETIAGVRVMIVQWTKMNFNATNRGPADLNFQVVLFETGNVEYRYGEMKTESTLNPDAADGANATIGLQDPTRENIVLLLTHNKTVAGKLRNRSWAFNLLPTPTGSVVMKPSESTVYRLCANNGSLYEVCEEVRVVVVGPGDLMISELMVSPTNVSGEWFEIRNLAVDPIDLTGFRIGSGPGETYLIPSGVIDPGGYSVMARSDVPEHNGGLTPDVVYGDEIELKVPDELVLQYGEITIDRLNWTGLWPIEPNQSIMLEPSRLERKESANDASSNWCITSDVFGGGFSGNPGQLGPGCLSRDHHAYYLLDPASNMPFIDISGTGRALNDLWELPYHSEPIPLGFTFRYFGVPVTEITILRDGALAMTPPTGSILEDNRAIPNAAELPNGLICPMWESSVASTCQYEGVEIDGQRLMIVQWTDSSIAYFGEPFGWATFQAQLWENGDIVFAYGPARTIEGAELYTLIYGANATIGLENIRADQAFTFYSSTDALFEAKPVYPGKTLHFHAR